LGPGSKSVKLLYFKRLGVGVPDHRAVLVVLAHSKGIRMSWLRDIRARYFWNGQVMSEEERDDTRRISVEEGRGGVREVLAH